MTAGPQDGMLPILIAVAIVTIALQAGAAGGAAADLSSFRPHNEGTLVVEAASARDLNGDRDLFADAGEIVRMTIILRNDGPVDLRNALLRLTTTDPDVACITRPALHVPFLAAGDRLDTASLGSPQGEFEFVVSSTSETTDAEAPATASFRLERMDGRPAGSPGSVTFVLPLDLDLHGGPPVRVAGPDGEHGSSDDGRIVEDFDTDRSGDGALRVGLLSGPDHGNDTIGVLVGTAPGSSLTLAGIGCGGFEIPPQDPECRIDPDHDLDWHLHCPAGAPAAACPSTARQRTPPGGSLAFNGDNALHWGVHFDPSSTAGDSVHFRQLAAFVTTPINLTPFPAPGELELSFVHIAAMMDHNEIGFPVGQASDFGDVHIQVDQDPDPDADAWGYWDKLVPFENAYDHVAYIWSAFGTSPTYCILTPTDGAPEPSSPRGVRELLCFPEGVWSSCGNHRPPGPATWDCVGPAHAGSQGNGLWVRTRFDLWPFAGRRLQIRWIAQSWEFDCCSSSYHELGNVWASERDDGWWIDGIRVNGAVERQATPVPDQDPPANGRCAFAPDRAGGR